MSNPFDIFDNDDLDAPAETVREQLTRQRDRDGVILPAGQTFDEPCIKCGGTGKFRGYGTCFACKGRGKKTFKTNPAQRAKARARAVEKKVEQANAAIEWREQHAAEIAWLNATAERQHRNAHEGKTVWGFPVELAEKLAQYGTLTDGQLQAVQKCIARDEARRAERKAQAEREAPVVDAAGVDRLKAAFDHFAAQAAEQGLGVERRKTKKLTFGGVTIGPAGANSRNPGALYAYENGNYVGKITDGRFFATRECGQETTELVVKLIADPKAAAETYGQTTGVCCVCNRTLRSEWKYRGIGPVCAEKFGW